MAPTAWGKDGQDLSTCVDEWEISSLSGSINTTLAALGPMLVH